MGIDDWSALARSHGRRAVMSLQISDAELDAETARQNAILFPMIAQRLNGAEKSALDYGCGAGRWTHSLAQCIRGRAVGYDPCAELIAMAPGAVDTDFCSASPEMFFAECEHNGTTFDVVFAAQVLGSPGLNLEVTAADLVSVTTPGGLLIVIDHMPVVIPSDRWWRFRPMALYQALFKRNGVELEKIGSLMQLDNEITVLSGRKE